MRVRPKLMTVGTMLVGLMPLLWATGSGADVMKRIAAPMVGGLITSAFLTLEIIPVVYTYWRQEQVLWERLEPARRAPFSAASGHSTAVQQAGWILLVGALASTAYLSWPEALLLAAYGLAVAAILGGAFAYLRERPAARRLVWPRPAPALAA